MKLLEIRVLGYPDVYVDGQLIQTFLSNKVIVLLCYVSMNPQIHSRERLAGLFWGDMPDSKAKANLRQALHNLSIQLGDYLDINRQTVQLQQDSRYRVDAIELKELSSDLHAKYQDLEDFVESYRGEFLEGINLNIDGELDDWIRTEREKNRLLFLDILERISIDAIENGDWHSAQNALRQSLSIEPLRETTHRNLMLCLARQERIDEALVQYRICEELLTDELGIEPVDSTRALYERLVRARQMPRHNLLSEATPFMGRVEELLTLYDQLKLPENRLLTIVGQGGIGKSRLARQYARKHHSNYLNGACYVGLASYAHGRLAQMIAQALDLKFTGTSPDAEQLISALIDYELLLILDNFEHHLDEADLLSKILKQTGDVDIIVTSRVRVNILGEQVYYLEGLKAQPAGSHDRSSSERIQFLMATVKRHKLNIDLSDQIDDVKELCDLLDGIPLALELAAAQVISVSCSKLIEAIQSDIDVLTTTMRDMPPHHRSMRSVMDYSWQMLDTSEQSAMLILTIFQDGFSVEAAQQVANIPQSVLTALVNKSLLSRIELNEIGQVRFKMHEILQQYVVEKLDAVGGYSDDIQANHADYYYNLIAESNAALHQGTEQRETITILRSDIENILQMTKYVARFADEERVIGSTRCTHAYYYVQGYYNEALKVFDNVIDLVRRRNMPQALAAILAQSGSLNFQLSEFDRAQQQLSEALYLIEESPPTRLTAEILNALGAVSTMLGNYETGMDYLSMSIDVYKQHDDLRGELRTRFTLGHILKLLGKFDQATQEFEEIVHISRENNFTSYVAIFLPELCKACIKQGQTQTVKVYIQECYDLYHEMNNQKGLALCDTLTASVYLAEGDFDNALTYFEKAIPVQHEHDDKAALIETYKGVGTVYLHQGKYELAQSAYLQAIDLAMTLENQQEEALLLGEMGIVSVRQMLNEEALSYFQKAFHIAGSLNNPYVILNSLNRLWEWLRLNQKYAISLAVLGLLIHHPDYPVVEKQASQERLKYFSKKEAATIDSMEKAHANFVSTAPELADILKVSIQIFDSL